MVFYVKMICDFARFLIKGSVNFDHWEPRLFCIRLKCPLNVLLVWSVPYINMLDKKDLLKNHIFKSKWRGLKFYNSIY